MSMAQQTLLDYIYIGHRWLSEMEKTPRDFGTGEIINPSAIHTLVAVSRKPGCNLTQLAGEMDVSKAAVSKFAAGLIKRGYLLKHSPKIVRGREVFFTLTTKGEKAVQGHEAFVRSVFGPLMEIEQKLPVKEQEVIRRYFESLKKIIGK
jgi:DNA-binding MarR family transcriptional regulator